MAERVRVGQPCFVRAADFGFVRLADHRALRIEALKCDSTASQIVAEALRENRGGV